jgi:hypothetical protein
MHYNLYVHPSCPRGLPQVGGPSPRPGEVVTRRALIHGKCGHVALHYDDPTPGEPLYAHRAHYDDGHRPRPLDPIVCQSCGEQVAEHGWRLDLRLAPND